MATDVSDVLSRAADVLAELRAVDLDEVADDSLTEAVLATQRLRGSLEVAEARLISRWDARGVWRPSGAKSAAAWLTWRQHLPISVARQRVRHARALRTLPALEQAWGEGDLDRAHVVTLLGACNPRTAEAFATDHPHLVEVGRSSWFTHFKTACDRWALVADPDGAEQGAKDDLSAREVHLSQTLGDMWYGRMVFDPISGEIVHQTLSIIERELFDADWAEAKARLGRDPMIFELARTPAQRRADAMVEMAIRARTAPAGGRRPAPLFSVVVNLETLTGPVLEMLNRTSITPGTAARWITQADIERIVFGPKSRVIDVGAKRRFFTGALRRAIEIRDRSCFHPTCDEVPERPQVDHIHEHSKGGPTTQDNGRWGCGHHNRWRYHHPHPDDDPDPG